MTRLLVHALSTSSLLLLAACTIGDVAKDLLADSAEDQEEEEEDFHWPSPEGYTDPGIPGWQGRTRISTTEGCWQDTDGVAPGVAGCHTLHDTADECSTCDAGVLETLGELCHTFTRTAEDGTTEEKRWLVETNPEAGACHDHAGGVGHPDVFDCDAYCQGTTDPEMGVPYTAGTCEAVADFDCAGTVTAAAQCVCTM